MDTLEFVLVRENSSRGDPTEIDNGRSSEMTKSLTSHHYKSYLVSMVHKLRTNTEVPLGLTDYEQTCIKNYIDEQACICKQSEVNQCSVLPTSMGTSSNTATLRQTLQCVMRLYRSLTTYWSSG
ncbi:hypothetical protein DPMN_179285 [Dreissena polymorpha]|uniref:Uncharacterized protein n=1 Tax=Dreissena polymorpha TaxID=45954 RepID=A0A9D4ECI3_DREPO|nr:hypothetical protein DPMN_179285 [Dreissena polymorpha]